MSDDYRREQDRIFHQMEDLRRIAQHVEAGVKVEAALIEAGVTIDGLEAICRSANRLGVKTDALQVLTAILDYQRKRPTLDAGQE